MMRLLLKASSRLPASVYIALGIFGLAASFAHAQLVQLNPGETAPSFEVASIRPNTTGSGREQIWHNDDSYRVENLSLDELIRNAWGAFSRAQLSGGPAALLDERFDLNAKISDDDTKRLSRLSRADSNRQVDLMMQSLLADRFSLKVHNEAKELPVFVLTIAKSGVKFHPSVPVPSAKPGAPPEPHTSYTMHWSPKGFDLAMTNHTIDTLTALLARQPELDNRPILDKTGLAGTFDFSLQWTPESMFAHGKAADPAAATDDPPGPSIFTALQDQLGLKLESQKAPVEVLVIDHVEPPSAN
ncbi:MAG: TIGR03435 family protein [Acidobacteriaceae bacterium]